MLLCEMLMVNLMLAKELELGLYLCPTILIGYRQLELEGRAGGWREIYGYGSGSRYRSRTAAGSGGSRSQVPQTPYRALPLQ